MLTSDSEALAENKVLILYILDKVNKPINNDSLYKLVLSALDMNYFYFQQFLLDLIETKYIVNYHKESRRKCLWNHWKWTKYTCTYNGYFAWNYKTKGRYKFKKELEHTEEEYSIVAEYTPRSENNYIVFVKS